MCCACAGTCSHIGNHFFCEAHKPQQQSWMPVMPGVDSLPSQTLMGGIATWRMLFNEEVVRRHAAEAEVHRLKQSVSDREDEIALLRVIVEDVREQASVMVREARAHDRDV